MLAEIGTWTSNHLLHIEIHPWLGKDVMQLVQAVFYRSFTITGSQMPRSLTAAQRYRVTQSTGM